MTEKNLPGKGAGEENESVDFQMDDSINDATLLVCLADDDTPNGGAGSDVPVQDLRSRILQVEGGRKYEVRRLVAKGGMGLVYEASDINCDRTVALKVLMADQKNEQESKRRFVSEARITSRLEHPNIVPIHELGKDTEGNVFYSMKYVRGVTLGDVLNDIRRGRSDVIQQYPLGRLLTIFQKTCDAVAFAHSHGVVHRDLKPGNIMIGKYGEVLVLDWGLARLIEPSARDTVSEEPAPVPGPAPVGAAEKLALHDQVEKRILDTIRVETSSAGLKTISGTVLGTPGFMAPEQVRRDGVIDSRTDIYALGAILYSILTLRAPIRERQDIPRLLQMILEGNITSPAEYGESDEAWTLQHCPDGRVPAVLSDITMKAMALNPADRYLSVKDFQQEIEDYQNGLVWHVVIDEDFSSVDALQRWEPMGCRCEIADGELRMYGGELQMILLKRDLPGDVRIDFECHQEGTYMNDVACLMSAIRSVNAWETSISGYAFKYGAYTNTMNVLTRLDRRIWSSPDAPLTPGQRYKIRTERVGNRLRMWVNGKEIFTVTDPDPLAGSNRTVVGLLGWIADTRFSRVTIYSLGTPWKSDILDIAERHLHKGHYVTAMDLFQEVIQSFPDAQRLERAEKGFDLARTRDHMERNLPIWQSKLAKSWPHLASNLKMENEGLTLEISNSGITDLSPLRGIPLTSLSCWGNRIRRLDPLHGMPLKMLNCAGNPIATLDPLRGLPLNILRCEACSLNTIEPLRGLPLTVLNCSENNLGADGLEPLRGMRLSWLACMCTGVKSIAPLVGMPLTWLFCDGNQIEDIESLKELPLTELSCRGNRIVDLAPLQGGKLNILRADENLVASLEPLRGLPLTTFSCCWNRISSLEPLRGLSISCLLCGGNQLKDIGSFIKNPSKVFFFDCDTISLKELEWIRQTWSRDVRFSPYVRDIEVLVALRKSDAERLRELASLFQGHHYLFVPKFVTWAEAKQACEALGGHLVTITSMEENEFVASLFPLGGSWFWIGLTVGKDKQEWITGEPLDFRAFVNVLQEQTPGPRVFSGRNWCMDVVPDSHNCFMIEWDS